MKTRNLTILAPSSHHNLFPSKNNHYCFLWVLQGKIKCIYKHGISFLFLNLHKRGYTNAAPYYHSPVCSK